MAGLFGRTMYMVQLAEFDLYLLYPEEGEKLIRNTGKYFPANSSSYIWGLASRYVVLADFRFMECDGASLSDTRRVERKCRLHLQVLWNKMQATRSFHMWGVSQWPRVTCQEIVILDNAAMETSKLECGIFLILCNSIKVTFHLSSHLLDISCWSPFSNNVANVIFLAKYFTAIANHRSYREFRPVSNKKSCIASEII
jgi:hypothetical protein